MYPQDQPVYYNQPTPPGRSNATLLIVIGLLTAILVGIISGAIGYWLGYRSASNQSLAVNANSVTPTPVPSVIPSPTKTPTPAPVLEIAPKYSGSNGDVQISGLTDKSFSFKISVGNAGGAGEVEGQATRVSPSVATFSQIPDESEYNDPESTFYKKKCKITFRFSPGKVTISEDDYACSYWHGAQIDFNGTFTEAKKK